MRVATYHRVSTLDQNPALAREELRAAAARLGTLALEVEEKGSGARNDRPGLQRLMEAVRRGKVDAVAVWKLDRFGRSTLDVLTNIRALTDAGASFHATSQGLAITSGGDAISRMMLTMLSAVAEFERDLIRDRTRLGMARARKAGRRIGRPSSLPADAGAKVRKLRDAGKTWAQIATALGCTPQSARRALDR
jgi:DNA invertase Pin-like site-specific DNA recombinase